jgi:hypothetical protein
MRYHPQQLPAVVALHPVSNHLLSDCQAGTRTPAGLPLEAALAKCDHVPSWKTANSPRITTFQPQLKPRHLPTQLVRL